MQKTPLFPILLVTFIDALGFSIVIPFMVVIVLKLGGHEVVYGLLSATYSFFQLIGSPILGAWSDKFGRKKILLISESGTFVAWVIFLIGLLLPNQQTSLFSIPLFFIFLGRAIDGLTGGNVSVANAYVADISSHEERKQNFGKMAAASNLGVIFGPLLAGILGATTMGNTLPVIATALTSLVAVFVIYFSINADKKVIPTVELNRFSAVLKQTDKKVIPTVELNRLSAVLKLPNVPYFLTLYFLIFLGFNFFYVGFPVYAAGELHWSVLQLGIFFAFLSGMMVLVEGPVLTFLAKKFSGASLIITGSLILCTCFILLKFNNIVLIYTGALLFAIGNGIMWPSFVALLSNTGDEHMQGMIQGFAGSAGSLASIMGLISGAFLYHIVGSGLFVITATFMLLIAFASIPLIKIEKSATP